VALVWFVLGFVVGGVVVSVVFILAWNMPRT